MKKLTVTETETVKNETDEVLMNQVKEGVLGSLSELFERYQKPIYNFFLRLTHNDVEESKDLTQSTFYRITKYRKSFNDKHSFRSWIFKLARNQFHDSYRKRERRKQHLVDSNTAIDMQQQENSGGGVVAIDVESAKDRHRRKTELEDALSLLSQDYKEILLMHKFEGLSYEEIGRAMGISTGAVKVKSHRALLKLRDIYYEERMLFA